MCARRRSCAFWVAKRQYSDAGPCENRRDLKPIDWEGLRVMACPPHRAMVAAGHYMTTVREGQREKAAQQAAPVPWLQARPRPIPEAR